MKRVSKSLEDYIEAILHLASTNEKVRSVNLATYMKVSRGAIHKILAPLIALGLIQHKPYGEIELTASGRNYAEEVQKTHTTLKKFLIQILNVDEQTAEIDACKMEHCVSRQTLEKITNYTIDNKN